jgi:hypothetical protein
MKIIVIGAGAAGLTAAITAAKSGAYVTILEHENKSGKKILITGNGKCNMTNKDLSSDKYYGDKNFIESVIQAFPAERTIDFFEQMGVFTRDKGGYIYPASEQAATIQNTLRDSALHLGVSIKTNNIIEKIEEKKDGFDIDVGINLHCDRLIIATGGMSFSKTGSTGDGYKWATQFGHSVTTLKPALTALICKKNSLIKAAGVRTRAKVCVFQNNVFVGSDTGEVQITDYGISGIPVFNISHLTECGSRVVLDFMPETDLQTFNKQIENIFKKCSFMSVASALNGCFNDKLVNAVLDAVSIKKTQSAGNISQEQILKIAKTIKEYSLEVKARRGFDFAQVTQGGISTEEIDCHTMESKITKNLYFAGEILDVDGICGGYNLQFAWATGAIAGKAAAEI